MNTEKNDKILESVYSRAAIFPGIVIVCACGALILLRLKPELLPAEVVGIVKQVLCVIGLIALWAFGRSVFRIRRMHP